MQSSVGIRERIDHVYPSLRPAERAVAQYIRNHIEEAADLTVGQMADIAHVSQPTVIRFARKLGFGGYRELRYVLRNPAAEHKVTFNPLAGFDLNPWDGEDEIPGKAADGAKALIDELHSALDPKAYRKAVALLAESEFIDIFGVEGVLKRPLIRHWDPLRTPMFARGFVVSWVRFPVSRNVVLQHSPTNLRVDLRNDFGSLWNGLLRRPAALWRLVWSRRACWVMSDDEGA